MLDQLENALRKCIKTNLEKLSANWWSERIPPDIIEKAELRREKDELKRDPVQYIDFADYVKIITRKDNWREVFKEIFEDQEAIAVKLRELEPIRNSVRHGRKLTSEQREKLKILSQDILRKLLEKELKL
ncbi:MAG: Swt1 family HEPN domain-containing protein [Thermoproteota archaeon]